MPNDDKTHDSAPEGPRKPASEADSEATAQPPQATTGTDHGDDFEPDPPDPEGDHPDPIAAGAVPDPLTPEQAAAEWRAFERRQAWPLGAAADELARAAERCGPSHVWWLGLLRAGELPGPQPWHEPIATDDLKLDWINAGAGPKGGADHALDIRFGRIVRDLCPGAERFRAWRPDNTRPWSYRLPPLDECRDRFQQTTLAKSRQRQGVVRAEPVLRALPKP